MYFCTTQPRSSGSFLNVSWIITFVRNTFTISYWQTSGNPSNRPISILALSAWLSSSVFGLAYFDNTFSHSGRSNVWHGFVLWREVIWYSSKANLFLLCGIAFTIFSIASGLLCTTSMERHSVRLTLSLLRTFVLMSSTSMSITSDSFSVRAMFKPFSIPTGNLESKFKIDCISRRFCVSTLASSKYVILKLIFLQGTFESCFATRIGSPNIAENWYSYI